MSPVGADAARRKHIKPQRAAPGDRNTANKQCVKKSTRVKGFGRRPWCGRGCGLEGRRPKASKGGNRGSARLWRRGAAAYGCLAMGRAAASGFGGVFSRSARAAVPSGTGISASNGGWAARRDARLAARIGSGADRRVDSLESGGVNLSSRFTRREESARCCRPTIERENERTAIFRAMLTPKPVRA